MKSFYIFIDTSIFISSNFNMMSKVFAPLLSLCKSGHVTMITTDVTIEEIKANLLESVTEAESIIKKASSKARVLRNLDEDNYNFLFENFNNQEIYDKLKEQITTFIRECNTTIIEATKVVPTKIFHDYFRYKPPFGKGKKKSEFPDAFVIEALCEWCNSNDAELNVISEDQDFKGAVELNDRLKYFPSLSKIIEMILADENILVNTIHDLMDRHNEKVFGVISEAAKEYEMLVEDADPDAEAFVENVSIIELSEKSIINITDDIATVVANAHGQFSIDVHCYNPDSWFKDPDDKSIHYWERIEDIFERDIDFEVEFDIQVNKNDINNFKITRVLVNNGELLSFYLDEDAGSFYK